MPILLFYFKSAQISFRQFRYYIILKSTLLCFSSWYPLSLCHQQHFIPLSALEVQCQAEISAAAAPCVYGTSRSFALQTTSFQRAPAHYNISCKDLREKFWWYNASKNLIMLARKVQKEQLHVCLRQCHFRAIISYKCVCARWKLQFVLIWRLWLFDAMGESVI